MGNFYAIEQGRYTSIAFFASIKARRLFCLEHPSFQPITAKHFRYLERTAHERGGAWPVYDLREARENGR